ncbi:PhzF family phenazine biosynthesis protein [Vibrio metschnikovii]|uniref:PhzF family phenazine biosynthesis protein n=1 Tax=Vibrio metschnikovii TaxID=28172 RepID=UPI001C3104B8|nr:PhzF family phenazine biosynthesis protein [Vibrio metschnikovii]EKO3771256.1 PhzF family phenazine biosynthesis protein [Vibrio metschnikovii]
MEVGIFQVDSFTSEVFKGNPAGVCITETSLDEATMLAIAAEMAVSETAFLSLDTMQLRWFTPEVEVSLCGHGTLAVAHVLKEQGMYKTGDILEFQTLSGTLTAHLDENNIHLLFPSPNLDMNVSPNIDILNFLGLSQSSLIAYGEFDHKQLIVINSESILNELMPDFIGLSKLKGRGVLVTAKSDSGVDFVSRYFAPWVGVNEDPVTGSAHCALCAYWSKELNKLKLKGYQASNRGGFVDVERVSENQVKLSGQAITVFQGRMKIA